MVKALEGVKVVDFSWAAAGPVTTKYLSDFGATLVRVESPSRPCLLRTSGPYKDGIPGIDRCAYFAFYNPNRYSISLNLNNPKGIELAKRLISWSDVVAECFTPGTMEKWSLGYEDIKEIKPDIIMYRTSIWGHTGPFTNLPGAGTQLVGLAGFTQNTGWPDRDACQPHGGYPDFIAPRFGAAAIIAALDYRDRTGIGQCLDLSQFEAGIQFLTPNFLDYVVNERESNRVGNFSPDSAPHGAYRCSGDDRWCAIAIFTDEEWEQLCHVIGDPLWTKDARFSSLLARKENEDELNKLIEEWTVKFTAEQVMALMQNSGVAAGIVENACDLYHDPQLQARGLFWPKTHREMGMLTHLGQASILSRTPAQPLMPAPCLGEHTEYVCREFLGISDIEFAELSQIGVFN